MLMIFRIKQLPWKAYLKARCNFYCQRAAEDRQYFDILVYRNSDSEGTLYARQITATSSISKNVLAEGNGEEMILEIEG